MPLKTIKIFIASSAELKEDREGFEKFINVENNRLNNLGFRIEIVQWEYFNDAVSVTRLQDEYNMALLQCDIALCLFFTKAGKYTEEEFDTAYRLFKEKGKPKIYTYFRDALVSIRSLTEEVNTLFHFRSKINALGHFPTYYSSIQDLMFQFKRQLELYLDANMPARIPVIEGTTSGQKEANGNTPDKAPVDYIFNEQLTKRLIGALSGYSADAKKIVNTRDWQTEPRLMDKAKASIAAAFVGVLGIQLRKLFAIGKESHSEEKSKNYIENCKVISRRALQFLCFALISRLWDYKKENTVIEISENQAASLKEFFECIRSIDSKTFIHLLKDLIDIFSANNLEFPIAELAGFQENLEEGSSFRIASNVLSATSDCMEAETQLTLFLEKLHFLGGYRMVSMKSIGYFEMRNTTPYYLYKFTALGIDSESNVNRQRVNQATEPINTEAVLLYKGSYKQNLNLFPFIIDINGLALEEGGTKVGFYAYLEDDKIVYDFLEDSSIKEIPFKDTLKPGININTLLSDPEKSKDLRFDNVHNLFHQAKRMIAGIEEEVLDNNDDFFQ